MVLLAFQHTAESIRALLVELGAPNSRVRFVGVLSAVAIVISLFSGVAGVFRKLSHREKSLDDRNEDDGGSHAEPHL